jgi:hypothetical protein
MTHRARRRLLMAGAGAALLAPFGTLARMLEPTPSQTAGPFYVAGDPRNAEDFLYRQVPADRRHLVTVPLEKNRSDGPELAAHFRMVLGVTPSG